jgi:hypothetical protein
MWGHQHTYIAEKLAEFDARSRAAYTFIDPLPHPRAERPLAPVVRATGRGMRRVGEAMEHWASPTMRMCETGRRR